MGRLLIWFKGLSGLAKASLIGGVATVGIIGASGQDQNSPDTTTSNKAISSQQTETKPEEKKKPTITTKEEVETVSIPYKSTTKNDSSLESGKTRIQTNGVNGEKKITHTITYTDGKETKRTSKETITKQPVNKVTTVGTYSKPKQTAPSCDPNYTGGCVPVVSYDLDCKDIGFRVYVVGTDIHRFDRDRDGVGCESY